MNRQEALKTFMAIQQEAKQEFNAYLDLDPHYISNMYEELIIDMLLEMKSLETIITVSREVCGQQHMNCVGANKVKAIIKEYDSVSEQISQ
jgi:hypothetical protein